MLIFSDFILVKPILAISSVLFQGANFRDLPGVIVGHDNVARLDPTKERILLPSGRPLVRCSRFTTLLCMCNFFLSLAGRL